MMDLFDLITETSVEALALQDQKTGAMPSGHNGPYFDKETPVRNTSHWIITFLKAFEITEKPEFKQAAEAGIDYLLSKEALPYSATFFLRTKPQKDKCNGLIGQAWCIEALVKAACVLDREDLITVAEEVFSIHPQEEDLHIWKRVDIDGSILPADQTFNHQLWFAATGASLIPFTNGKVKTKIEKFLDQLDQLFILHTNGLIHHPIIHQQNKIKQNLKCMLTDYIPLKKVWRDLKIKEIGYHSFNLYGFALLKLAVPNHSFWSHLKFQAALGYLDSQNYLTRIEENPYGYPYNPPGIEAAFALQVFQPQKKKEIKGWLKRQFQTCYNNKTKMMELNSSDKITSSARIYEATRIENIAID